MIPNEYAVPRLCDLSRPSVVLGQAEWAIACRIDGLRTVGELASRAGIEVRDAMERVGGLVRSGLCTITATAVPGHGDRRLSAGMAPPLPRRVRDTAPPVTESPAAQLDLGLLRQILDGLRSLD